MPRIVNWKDERWKLFQRKREEWLQDYMPVSYTHLDVYKRQVDAHTVEIP